MPNLELGEETALWIPKLCAHILQEQEQGKCLTAFYQRESTPIPCVGKGAMYSALCSFFQETCILISSGHSPILHGSWERHLQPHSQVEIVSYSRSLFMATELISDRGRTRALFWPFSFAESCSLEHVCRHRLYLRGFMGWKIEVPIHALPNSSDFQSFVGLLSVLHCRSHGGVKQDWALCQMQSKSSTNTCWMDEFSS